MSEGTIDKLTIEVEGISSDAARRLDAIAVSLGALKNATSGLRLTSAANGISKLARSLASIPPDATGRISGLASVLRPLAGIGNIKLGQLGRLPAVMKEFSSLDVASFAAQMRQLNSALAPLAASVQKLSGAYSAMPPSMRSAGVAARSVKSANENLTRATDRLAKANNGVFASFGNVQIGLSGMKMAAAKATAAWYLVKRTVGSAINNVNTYIENMNLFQASMGSAAKSATEFGMKVQEVMGIDFGQWARNQGVFQTLATGMGVASDKASVMSQQLTQLGYDISSFYNLSVEDAMLKLQSGLAGELEPLRRIGWDLSNARMNLELSKMGIEANAQSMTQAEKVAMRYKMIMEQVTITHGDMARTLNSPANQIRILKAQLDLAARAIGNLFIPMINKILPYAIGAAKAVRTLAQEIANFLHLDVNFDVDYSTLDTSGIVSGEDAIEDTASALDDAGDAAEEAQKKVKEYQNTVMGFDELNKLNGTPEDTSGGAGAGGSGLGDEGAGIGLDDLDLPTYDFLKGLNDKVARLSDEIAAKMVGALKRVLPVAAAVGAAIAGWKVASALMGNLDKLDAGLSRASRSAANLAGRLSQAGKVRLAGVTAGMADALGNVRLGLAPMLQFPSKFAAAAVPWVAAVALVAGHFVNLVVNSENFRRGLERISEWLGKLPSPLEAVKGAFEYVKDVAGDIGRFLGNMWSGLEVKFPFLKDLRRAFDDVAGSVMELVKASGLLDVLKTFGDWVSGTFAGIMDVFDLQWTDAAMAIGAVVALLTGNPVVAGFILAAEAVSLAIRAIGWATSPVIEEVDALADVSEETAQKFGTSLDSMGDSMQAISEFDWANKIIGEEDVARIERNVKDIHDTIVNNLDAKRNEELASIEALGGVMTDEEVEAAKQAVNEYYDDLIGIVDNGQAEILGIMSTAQGEGRALTEEESERIKQINDEQYRYLLETSGASAEELNKIREAMDNNDKASALEAAKVVSEAAKSARDEQKASAEDAYNTVYSWATRMRDTGDMTEEEYQRIMAAAEETRNQTIADAEEQYDRIRQETESGLGDIADEFDWETSRIKEKWTDMFTVLGDWWDWFASKTSSGLHIGMEVAGSDGPVVTMGTARYDTGGFPAEGQLFFARENAQPELVGRMGRRTAVANNAQIVEGIEAGVTNAMLSVLPSISQGDRGDVNLVLMVDSESIARASAKGAAAAARRGQISTSMAFSG